VVTREDEGVPPLDGVHGAPRHALVLAGHHRPAHRAA